jgi:hypothetical protein
MDESWSNQRQTGADHLSAFAMLGIQGQVVNVTVPGATLDGGAAVAGHGLAVGHAGRVTYRARGSAAVGGQTSGFVTQLEGEAAIGPFVQLSDSARLFVRVGMTADSYVDDELDTSVYTLPSASAGIQLATESVVFELSPRAAAALRATYAPGSEEEGRRFHRASKIAPAFGGAAVVMLPFAMLDAAVDRVGPSNELWLARGRLCGNLHSGIKHEGVSACGWGQYWSGGVVGPTGAREVAATAAGLAIGYGALEL